MDLQLTQVLDDERVLDDNDDNTQVGILRIGSTEHSIVKGFTKIGRSPALCKIVLNDPTVSKVHAEIQAGCETTFISDVRSANGTKIKDVQLKPFFYYTINDGDAIYFGTVKATFTTNKSSDHSSVILPETPIPSRRLSEINTPDRGNTSDCLFNNTSVYQSDDSVVPGTQRKEKRTPIFQEPPVPIDRQKGSKRFSLRAVALSASEKSEKIDEATKSRDAVDATDLHDLETQKINNRSFLSQSRAPKRPHLEKVKQDLVNQNIYDAETQVLPLATENEGAADEEKSNKGRKNDTTGSCVDANIYDAETQILPLTAENEGAVDKGKNKKSRKNDAAGSFVDENIYDAETQVLLLTAENKGAADQKKTTKNRKNDTTASSSRMHNSSSNFSRELQISSSPSPPDSPNPMDQSADMSQSQNLLELCETPLLEYAKKANSSKNASESNKRESAVESEASASEKDSKAKVSPNAMEESVNRKKSVPSSHVIAESDDESATDDDMDIDNVEARPRGPKVRIPSRVSDVIEDDSATDDEGKFEKFTSRLRPIEKQNLPSKIRPEMEDRDAEENIFEAATQQMDQKSLEVASAKKRRNLPKEMQCDTDIDLLPTQVLDVATSTPLSHSRKLNTQKSEKKSRLETEDDLHLAPTQIMSDGDDNVGRTTRERSGGANSSLGAENTEAAEKDDRAANLDETLMANLGRILDEEANIRELADEPTQLMTQNLVDILKPTQSFDETKSRVFDKDNDIREPRSPKKKKVNSPGTPGFVHGQAVAGKKGSKTVPIATSTMRDDGNEDEEETEIAVGQPRKSASGHILPECLDDDDFLFGLPEVKISGTLSNPGSPTSSSTSSHSDFVAPSLRESGNSAKAKEKVAVRTTEGPCSLKTNEAAKSLELDSPVVPKKSKVVRKKVSKNLIRDEDPDSDEAFAYNDLKKMADSLLASDSVGSARSRKKDNDGAVDEPETLSSTGRRMRHVRQAIPSKKDKDSSRRARKLPQPSSSLLVSDVKSKRSANGNTSTDAESSSAGASKNSSRLSKSKKPATSRSKVASKRGKESQEKETVLATTPKENIPVTSKKSYAKVQLTRLDNSNVRQQSNDADNLESPKVNRKRRATMSAKELTPAPDSPTVAKSRRTIAEGLEGRVLPKEQHKILITGLSSDDYSKIVKKLGGEVVSEPSKATVLITDKVRRTYKFLCAVAQGLRVVSINWLLESKKAARFLDCDNFILNDPAAERQYKFKLGKSLQIARTKKFLEGYTIIITPKVNQPEIHELKAMVEACGGRILTRPPASRAWNSKTVIVSRVEDLAAINSLLSKCPKSLKVTVQSTEFIFTGILRQEVNLVEHKLDIP